MLHRTALALLVLAAACTDAGTAPPPRTTPTQPHLAVAPGPDGPPPAHAFGPDTYRTHLFTGAGVTTPGLKCAPTAAGHECVGFLASAVDGTRLDVTLDVPRGGGPFPLVVLLHGWAGSKSGMDYIADSLLADGDAVLRYSARGFGESWGQTNLADEHVELADLRSLVGQLLDRSRFHLDPNAIAIAGESYGGGQTWLSAIEPTFTTPRGTTAHIRALVPIVPWTDLLYALLPNGTPRYSLAPLGGDKFSYVNALYISGVRHGADRPYPNYPDYLATWHAWIDGVEPNALDPVYRQIVDGLAGGRSIWWQQSFWSAAAANRIPVFEVQGFTDDLFPLPEAARMVDALRAVDPTYPITLYVGDIGHPRARNKPGEMSYVIHLLRGWLAYYLRGVGAQPVPVVYAAVTRPASEPFDPANVLVVGSLAQLATDSATRTFTATKVLVNPIDDPVTGFYWDPLIMAGAEALKPYFSLPPESVVDPGSLVSYTVPAGSLGGGAPVYIAGCPRVTVEGAAVGARVQLDVRLFDMAPDGARQLVTRGTYTLTPDAASLGAVNVTIPTYGNLWRLAPDHALRLELTNLDAPYIEPSRLPSVTTVTKVELELPLRRSVP